MFPGNRRKWTKRSFIVVAVIVMATAWLVPTAVAASSPRMTAAVLDDLIIASLRDFPASTEVKMVATANGASGQSMSTTSTTGRLVVAFEPPEGFIGDVLLTATSGTVKVTQSITFEGTTAAVSPSPGVNPVQEPAPGTTNSPSNTGTDESTASPAPVSDTCLSGGSGGVYQDALSQSFTGAGLTSEYHLFASGLPTTEPVGLLLQFHGDGAYEFKNPTTGTLPGIAKYAKSNNLLMIANLTPDSDTVTWWEDGAANADYMAALIKEVAYAGYNIDKSRIWLVGYSGGSQFTTQFFLPAHSDLLCGGGSVVFGGGGTPRVDVRGFAPSFVDNFRMHWYTGADDTGPEYNALRDLERGSAFYKDLGFAVTTESPAGVGHGGLPFAEVVGEQLTAAG